MKLPTPMLTALVLATPIAQAATLVQTNSDYIAFNAIDFDSKEAIWTQVVDDTNSVAFAGSAMVYNNTGAGTGIDASTGNAQGTPGSDTISYSLDFTSAGDYHLYVRVAGSFFAGGQNDSVFIPGDWGGSATNIANSLVNNSSDYNWARLADVADALGSGVRDSSLSGIGFFNVDGTEGTGGNSIGFSIAGREQDIQLDRIVFHKNASLDATTLDGLTVVPEPSNFALFAAIACAGLATVRRREK